MKRGAIPFLILITNLSFSLAAPVLTTKSSGFQPKVASFSNVNTGLSSNAKKVLVATSVGVVAAGAIAGGVAGGMAKSRSSSSSTDSTKSENDSKTITVSDVVNEEDPSTIFRLPRPTSHNLKTSAPSQPWTDLVV